MGPERAYVTDVDVKSGVLDAFVDCLLDDPCPLDQTELAAFEKNIRSMCGKLQAMIDEAEGQARKDMMHKCILADNGALS